MPHFKNKYAPPKLGKRIKQYPKNLNGLKALPKNNDVKSRIKTLQLEQNGKSIQRILIQVADEVIKCWKKQDMPVRARQTVITKLKRFYSYKG